MRAAALLVVLLLVAASAPRVAADQDEGIVDDVVNIFQSILHNITTKLEKKLVQAISSQTCSNNGAGEHDPTMNGCFEDGVATPRVAEPAFWADVNRAAHLASYIYTPLKEIVAKDMSMRGYQLVGTFEHKFSSCEGMVTLRQKIPPVPSVNIFMAECEKTTTDSMACRKKLAAEREILWRDVEESTFAKPDPKVPPARIEVTVRGSQQLTDWIQNARFRQKPFYPRILGIEMMKKHVPRDVLHQVHDLGIEVHAGFRSQFMAVHEQVAELLKPYEDALKSGKTQLQFCGHSLGGAVAQLLAVHTANRLVGVKPTVYTFGSPRVGNPAWAAFERQKVTHFRFKYLVDPVAELPLKEIMGFKYEHGDTAAYSFSVLPPASKRSSFLLPIQVLCTPECGRGRMDPALASIVHSSDMSYSQAASIIFMNMRDQENAPGPYFPGAGSGRKQNNQFLTDIEQAFSSQLAISQAVVTLQCFGDRFCEHMRKYPGIPLEKHIQCLKERVERRLGRNIEHLEKRIDQHGADFRKSKERKDRMNLDEQVQVFVADLWLAQYYSVAENFAIQRNPVVTDVTSKDFIDTQDPEAALAKCLGAIDKTYYDKFTQQDWAMCGGNYPSILALARQKGLLKDGATTG